ncbi:unnamed protein product, partial [Ectocarpus sp. 13 AM-2016]
GVACLQPVFRRGMRALSESVLTSSFRLSDQTSLSCMLSAARGSSSGAARPALFPPVVGAEQRAPFGMATSCSASRDASICLPPSAKRSHATPGSVRSVRRCVRSNAGLLY